MIQFEENVRTKGRDRKTDGQILFHRILPVEFHCLGYFGLPLKSNRGTCLVPEL